MRKIGLSKADCTHPTPLLATVVCDLGTTSLLGGPMAHLLFQYGINSFCQPGTVTGLAKMNRWPPDGHPHVKADLFEGSTWIDLKSLLLWSAQDEPFCVGGKHRPATHLACLSQRLSRAQCWHDQCYSLQGTPFFGRSRSGDVVWTPGFGNWLNVSCSSIRFHIVRILCSPIINHE